MHTLFDSKYTLNSSGTGFIAHMQGESCHSLVQYALRALENIAEGHSPIAAQHRIKKEAHEHNSSMYTGDGVGILCSLPRKFFCQQWPFLQEKVDMPWAVGQCFMPRAPALRSKILNIIAHNLSINNLQLLASREVPVNAHILQARAHMSMPFFMQLLVTKRHSEEVAVRTEAHEMDFEYTLYVARRSMEKAIYQFLQRHNHDVRQFHMASLSGRSIIYKGLLSGARLGMFYPDMQSPLFSSSFAIFHQCFAGGLVPSWRAVQPMRTLASMGSEMHTESLRRRWRLCSHALRYDRAYEDHFSDADKILPVIDSLSGAPLVPAATAAALDNICEFLLHKGHSVSDVLHMFSPHMGHAHVHEPYHLLGAGQAVNVVCSDARTCLALSQHSEIPCKYAIFDENMLIAGPALGLLDVDKKRVRQQGHIPQNSTLFVDLQTQRMRIDRHMTSTAMQSTVLQTMPSHKYDAYTESVMPEAVFQRFRYSKNTERILRALEAQEEQAPFFAEALALFSENPCFFSYFRAISSFFYGAVACDMSVLCHVSRRRNGLSDNEQVAHIMLASPILTLEDLKKLLAVTRNDEIMQDGHNPVCLQVFFSVDTEHSVETKAGVALENALGHLRKRAEEAVKAGASVLVISHNGQHGAGQESPYGHECNDNIVPIPALLAVSSIHSHLFKKDLRHLCSIVAEVGDASTAMHMVQLLHAGADCICPFVALSFVHSLGLVHENYVRTLEKNICRIVQNFGIKSVRFLQHGAFFEAIGIDRVVLDAHFMSMSGRLSGIHMQHIAQEAHARWQMMKQDDAFNANGIAVPQKNLKVQLLQKAVRLRRKHHEALRAFQEYSTHCHEDVKNNPRSLLDVLVTRTLVPITKKTKSSSNNMPDNVPDDMPDSMEDILKRFVCMSTPKVNTLTQHCLANILKGVGGQWCDMGTLYYEDSIAIQLEASRKSMNASYLLNKEELLIALWEHMGDYMDGRHRSEKRHHDVLSPQDISYLVHTLRRLQPHMRICVLLPASAGVGALAAVLVRAGAHALWLCGSQHGGQGILQKSYEHLLPWELGLAEVQHVLTINRLRRRVRLRIMAPLFSAQDVIKATLLGAEEFSMTAPLLVSLGCHMCEHCNDVCPGALRADADILKFQGDIQHGIRFLRHLAEDIRTHVARLGYSYLDQLIGRAELLEKVFEPIHKGEVIDISALTQGSSGILGQRGGMPSHAPLPLTGLERALLEKLQAFFYKKVKMCHFSGTVRTTDIAVGTHLSGEILRKVQDLLLEKNALIHDNTQGDDLQSDAQFYSMKLWGSAGQCLGAFLIKGVTLYVYGDANDHVGKGLCGGVVVIAHAPDTPLAEESGNGISHAIIGNAALYGATSGEAYVAGSAGEYFAVCNHGAQAVVEGVGDNACLHMQGGTVLVLGHCGKNLAQHMRGGTVYIYKPEQHYPHAEKENTNLDANISDEDRRTLKFLLQQHVNYTKSPVAKDVLEQWDMHSDLFAKIDGN